MTPNYHRGVVESYNEKAGYGYVIPDESNDGDERLLIHSRSFRHPSTRIEIGDRIVYRVELVPRGLLAADVVLEVTGADDRDGEEKVADAAGTITLLKPDRGFGYIDSGSKRVFFRLSEVLFPPAETVLGSKVSFQLVQTSHGPEARSVANARTSPGEGDLAAGGVPAEAKDRRTRTTHSSKAH